MVFLAGLDLRDRLLIIQIIFTIFASVPAFLALYLLFRQFRIHTNSLTLNAMATRHQLFVSLTDSLSKETHDTALLHVKDWFDLKVFEERYKECPQKIQSYLLMQRKYLYLVFSSFVENGFPVRERGVAELWIRELGEFYEFHDVHARHGRYYPEFSKYIRKVIGDDTPKAWMCESSEASDA